MQTLTEQLVKALEAIYRVARTASLPGPVYLSIAEVEAARAALDRARADPEALLRENGEAVRRLGNELMAKQGKGR